VIGAQPIILQPYGFMLQPL